MCISGFIKRHPVSIYFALTFAISWGGFILVVGPGGFPGTKEQFGTLFPIVVSAMLAGPSIAGILLTGLVDGRAGFRELLSRLFRWRVGARWYAVALLPVLILPAAVLFALSITSPVFTTDDKAAVLLSGIAAGLSTIFEELGRRGLSNLISALIFLLWCSTTDGLQGTYGVGLRPYREPACDDAHACKSYSEHDLHLRASGDRGVLPDLYLGIDRRAVVSGCSSRRGQWLEALTEPAARKVKPKRSSNAVPILCFINIISKRLLGIHTINLHLRARGLVGYDVALTQRRS